LSIKKNILGLENLKVSCLLLTIAVLFFSSAHEPRQTKGETAGCHLFEKQVRLELPLMEDGGNNNFYGDEVSFVTLCAIVSDVLVSRFFSLDINGPETRSRTKSGSEFFDWLNDLVIYEEARLLK
jgi:hypothetical protein